MSFSLAARSLLAVVLMIGFYALALGIAGGLLYIPYAEVVYGERLHFRLLAFCVIGAGLILFSIVPRRDRFVPPGPLLEPAKQPRLFERLTKLSRMTNQPMPREVYLVSDLNAWVAQRGGIMGVGSRRVMGIGLPLLQVLTTSQFEAVLAHEFGHYHGGDTKLGPWIYKTRVAIGRTLQSLATDPNEGWSLLGLLQVPFRWYGTIYLRITLAISRAQEFSADRLAAGISGSRPLIEGLRTIHRAAAASTHYLHSEVFPVIHRGFQPPLVQGFALFLANDNIARFMDQSLQAELASPARNAYDTHPPLKDRIAAVEKFNAGAASDESAALTLLEQVSDLENQLAASWLNPGAPQLRPISWTDTGSTVLLPSWEVLTKRGAKALDQIVFEQLFDVAKQLDPFARKLDAWQTGVAWESVRQYASSVLGAAFACALHRRGWTIESSPGECWLTSGASRLNPFDLVSSITSGKLEEQEWKQMIAELGLDPAMPLWLPNEKS